MHKKSMLTIAFVGLGAVAALGQTTDQVAAAADLTAQIAMKIQNSITATVTGGVVTNEPYSATGTTESMQTLGDGTHIRNQSQYTIYRDAEGRERREESATEIVISDPVAHTSYVLNPAKHTFVTRPLAGLTVTTNVGTGTVNLNSPTTFTFTPTGGGGGRGGRGANDLVSENLGTQNIQGVNAIGTRRTATIPEGSIGNDRPIQTVTERWTSPELQVLVMSKTTDPRNGETVFQLTNINRNPPDPSLFQVPPGYQPAPVPAGRGGRGGGEEIP